MASLGSNIWSDNKETKLQIEACLLDNFNGFVLCSKMDMAQFIWKNLASFFFEILEVEGRFLNTWAHGFLISRMNSESHGLAKRFIKV